MKTGRLEAFSDGVLAIIITIMVLEMKVPKGYQLENLEEIISVFFSYGGSFLFIGIYWLQHHHLFQTATKVNSKILWANLNLLFWLSLLPFATSWLDESNLEKAPVVMYSVILFISGLSFNLLGYFVVKSEGENSALAKEMKKDRKGIISGVLNFLAVIMAFIYPLVAIFILVLVVFAWIVPDKRVEKAFYNEK
ncbi:MAG: DUF1211 domain-containing protein [Flavobacteriaceae bacterium]|nr:DUF1211 domain-containing protein [Flavobacteriaceae bacterium]